MDNDVIVGNSYQALCMVYYNYMATFSKTCLTNAMCGAYTRYYLQTCDFIIAGYQYEPNPERTCTRILEGADCPNCAILTDCCAYTNIDCCQRVITPMPTTMPSHAPTGMPSYFCNNESIPVDDNTCSRFQVFQSNKIFELDNGDMLCCADSGEDCCRQSYVIFIAAGGTLLLIVLFFMLAIYMNHEPEKNKRRVSPLDNILP